MDPAAQSSADPKKTEPADGHGGRATSSDSDATSDSSDGDDFFQLDPAGGDPLDEAHSPRMPAQSSFNPFEAQPAESRPSASPPLPPTAARSDVADPNRIPSSIFTRTKSNSPMEWSVASNESLFSIHVGNASFSRDNVFLAGRSGELNSFTGSPYGRSGEMNTNSFPGSTTSPVSPFPASFPPPLSPPPPVSPLPPIPPAPSSAQPTASEARSHPAQPGAVETSNAGAATDAVRTPSPDKDANHLDKCISRQSDGSATSSFAFPILTGDGVRSGSMKVGPDHQEMPARQTPPEPPEQHTPKLAEGERSNAEAAPAAGAAAAGENKGWFSCFCCCCR